MLEGGWILRRMMNKKLSIAIVLLVLAVSAFVGVVLLFDYKNEQSGTITPTVSQKPTDSPTPFTEVDEKLLGKLYTKIFPEESLAETLEGNDYESFGARLELRHFRSVK